MCLRQHDLQNRHGLIRMFYIPPRMLFADTYITVGKVNVKSASRMK